MASTGRWAGLQADESCGRVLAGGPAKIPCSPASTARPGPTRHSSTHTSRMLEEAERRDHRRLGREMDLFHFQEEGPGVVFWHARAGRCSANSCPTCAAASEDEYEEVNAPQFSTRRSGRLRAIGAGTGKTCSSSPRRTKTSAYSPQAHELSGPCANLQARPEGLPRSADTASRSSGRCIVTSRRARCTG